MYGVGNPQAHPKSFALHTQLEEARWLLETEWMRGCKRLKARFSV